MDPNALFKNHIGTSLARRFADALAQEVITADQAAEIAEYVLENIDKAKNAAELVDFLEELCKKWPLFTPVLTMQQEAIVDTAEDKAVEKAEELLGQNKIDEALAVAENAQQETIQSVGGYN